MSSKEEWDAAISRMARTISGWPAEVFPFHLHNCRGFSVRLRKRTYPRRFTLAISDDGSQLFFSSETPAVNKRPKHDPDDEFFGGFLQKAGLFDRGIDDAERPADSVVMDTLRRLDSHALEMLRTSPMFSLKVYEFARRMPREGAFARLVAELPMLGNELRELAAATELSPSQKSLIESDDPLRHYLDIVENFAKAWPTQPAFDRAAAERALKLVGRIAVISDSDEFEFGMTNMHIAWLSYAPIKCIPRTPDQVAAFLSFVSRWSDLFKWFIGMHATDFYDELEKVLDCDWIALRDRGPDTLLGDIMDAEGAVARMYAIEHGLEPQATHDRGEIGIPLMHAVISGRGFMAVCDACESWHDAKVGISEDDVEARFRILSESEFLPAAMRDASAGTIVGKLEAEPERFLRQ